MVQSAAVIFDVFFAFCLSGVTFCQDFFDDLHKRGADLRGINILVPRGMHCASLYLGLRAMNTFEDIPGWNDK